MTIAVVGQAGIAPSATTSTSVTYSSTTGNTLVLMIQDQGGLLTGVTDTAGNTWTLGPDTQTTQSSTGSRRMTLAYCLNANHITSVTITQTTSSALNVNLMELSGVGSVRGTITAASTATHPPGALITGCVAGDIVIGNMGYTETTAGTTQHTIQSPWTAMTDRSPSGSTTIMASGYQILTASATSGPLWILTSGSTGFSTIALSAGSTPPTAAYTYTVYGHTIVYDGTTSSAAGGATITGYAWDFGDGNTATGATGGHRFTTAGTYTVKLTVTDSNSNTNFITHSVVAVDGTTAAVPAGVLQQTGWTPATAGVAQTYLGDNDPTTFILSSANPSALELDIFFAPIIKPASGQPFVVTMVVDRLSSSSGTVNAQLIDFDSSTQRSSLSSVPIQDMTASGGTGTTVSGTVAGTLELVFPWSDVQNVTDSGWDRLILKLQATSS